jgi:tRNA pseudouridine38-40 synthase
MRARTGQMWMATLAWRGTAYAGWQIQPNAPTIQGTVEQAVAAMCGLDEPVPVSATGRTDAGVHAEMQVVGFRLPVDRTPHQVMSGINFHTPADITCLAAQTMADDFSPRRWTKGKLYRYRILNRLPRCPFRDDLVWHLKSPLNVGAMSAAIAALVGQHDFSSFRAAGCSADTTVRTIRAARCQTTDDGEVLIEFEGPGFLRHQVRIMVGTLVDVGLGKRSAGEVASTLSAQDRAAAGPTAPAKGLTLVHVEVGDGPRLL